MLIHTRLGAAQLIVSQVAVALRPDSPKLLSAVAPPDPRTLRHQVAGSVNALALLLAGLALIVGALGIANTTLVAILERTGEIGVRRAMGARPVHNTMQFLAESTCLGLIGGMVGTSLGVLMALGVTIWHHWTAVLDPTLVFLGPPSAAVVGFLAGLHPGLRAAQIEPAEALRR